MLHSCLLDYLTVLLSVPLCIAVQVFIILAIYIVAYSISQIMLMGVSCMLTHDTVDRLNSKVINMVELLDYRVQFQFFTKLLLRLHTYTYFVHSGEG